MEIDDLRNIDELTVRDADGREFLVVIEFLCDYLPLDKDGVPGDRRIFAFVHEKEDKAKCQLLEVEEVGDGFKLSRVTDDEIHDQVVDACCEHMERVMERHKLNKIAERN